MTRPSFVASPALALTYAAHVETCFFDPRTLTCVGVNRGVGVYLEVLQQPDSVACVPIRTRAGARAPACAPPQACWFIREPNGAARTGRGGDRRHVWRAAGGQVRAVRGVSADPVESIPPPGGQPGRPGRLAGVPLVQRRRRRRFLTGPFREDRQASRLRGLPRGTAELTGRDLAGSRQRRSGCAVHYVMSC